MVLLGLATTGSAQTSDLIGKTTISAVMVPVTEGRGPGEKVVRFMASPDAETYRFPDAAIAALGAAMTDRNRAATRAAQLALGVQAFGDSQGAFAAMGTVAEHAFLSSSFSGVNTALNNIGFVFALGQVARDAVNGDTEAAVYGTLKAFVNYSIGRWGSSTLQIAGIATFVVDVTLREWQAGLTDIGVNVWTCRYDAFYRDHGMSVDEWKTKALEIYENAKKTDAKWFNTDLDAALNKYVHRAFTERDISFYSECNDKSFGDTTTIQRLIEAESKGKLEKMLVKYVLPEVSKRAWTDSLKQQISNANSRLKPLLNRTMLLEVTAYDAPEGAQVVMPLPRGGEWGGKLRPEGTFRAKLTYYALMKAGFPDRVRLESSEGSEEHQLILADGRLTTVFGVPQTPIVVRYQLEEGAQTCAVRRIESGKPITEEQQSRDARPPTEVDLALSGGNAGAFLGHYDVSADAWTPASPGRIIQKGLLFGAPYTDDIQALKNCRIEIFDNQNLASGDCAIERFERKQFGENKVIERRCVSPATIELIGIFASLGGGTKQYFSMDTPAGRASIDLIGKSMRNVLGGADPEALLRSLE